MQNDTTPIPAPEDATRRRLIVTGLGLAAATGFPLAAWATPARHSAATPSTPLNPKADTMNYLTTQDGTQIFFKDWGTGQPLVFSHGWPLSSDDWEGQMLYFVQRGFRVIAHDRRGHGRSSRTSVGHDMDHYADDLAALTAHLNLKDAIHIGHSTGGGEVVRYIARHGSARVAKAVLIGAVPPMMLKGSVNPQGVPLEVLDGIRSSVASNRAQFFKEFSMPFYGYNRPGAKISEGIREHWWMQGMMGSIQAHYEGIKAFSETNFTDDLKKVTVPTLVLHGDDDQIVPLAGSSEQTAKLLPNAKLKVYPGLSHGMCVTNADVINPDLLAFFKS